MKPILFNTDMVRAILDGRKTVTRRVVKLKYSNTHLEMRTDKCGTRLIEIENEIPGVTRVKNPDGTITLKLRAYIEKIPPYRPSDILYVREAWNYGYCDTTDFECRCNETFFEELKPGSMKGSFLFPRYFYRTEDLDGIVGMKWRPSIHMPREAARIFLHALYFKVRHLQDITDEDARKEGCKGSDDFHRVWNNCYSKPKPVKTKGVITHYESYPWEDIRETRTYRSKPWYVIGNPWVWVIEFERISKEKAQQNA